MFVFYDVTFKLKSWSVSLCGWAESDTDWEDTFASLMSEG